MIGAAGSVNAWPIDNLAPLTHVARRSEEECLHQVHSRLEKQVSGRVLWLLDPRQVDRMTRVVFPDS